MWSRLAAYMSCAVILHDAPSNPVGNGLGHTHPVSTTRLSTSPVEDAAIEKNATCDGTKAAKP